MKRKSPFLFWLVLFLSALATTLWGWYFFLRPQSPPPKNLLKVGQCQFEVEVARTLEEKRQGLSNRPSLDRFKGMLFVYDQPEKPLFWMKDMEFPLDFVWIQQGRVVDLSQNIPPPKDNNGQIARVSPAEPADWVLEINAGMIKECQIKVGDPVNFSL